MDMPKHRSQGHHPRDPGRKIQACFNRNPLPIIPFFLGRHPMRTWRIEKADPAKICGVKVFLWVRSTGNMLVDNPIALEKILQIPR